MKHILGFVAALAIASPLLAAEERYSVLFSGRTVGTLVADEANGTTSIVYDYKNNGRGPTISESVTVDAAYVRDKLAGLAQDSDLSKYIL